MRSGRSSASFGELPFERLTFIANPDEEIGSPTSSVHIRTAAADVDAALVLECARANGDIVSARKGILDTRIADPRPSGARRRRAREGAERDPRGGTDRARAARAQRSMGRGDRQRRQDRRRDTTERRRRAVRSRCRRSLDDGRRAARGRSGRPRDRRGQGGARHDGRSRGPRRVAADGEARAVGTPGRSRHGDRRRVSAST